MHLICSHIAKTQSSLASKIILIERIAQTLTKYQSNALFNRIKQSNALLKENTKVTYLFQISHALFNNRSHLLKSLKNALHQVFGGSCSRKACAAGQSTFSFSIFISH
jgi:hypothetical protein